jgi:outer membrane protein assembly factor BamB
MATPTPTILPTATPTLSPTPEPPLFVFAERPIGDRDIPLCLVLSAPALLFDDIEEAFPGQASSLLLDLTSNELCRLVWADWPQSRHIQFVDGFFYYAAFDDDESAYFVWQDDGRGEGQPLPFTKTVVREQYASYFLFLVAPDGRSLVWSVAADEGERMTGYLMQYAQLDGQRPRRLLQTREQGSFSYYEPLRFTADGRLLYAHQPLGLGGWWGNFHGNYQNLYQLDLSQSGEPELLFACDTLLCLGDISADGRYLAYTLNNQIYVAAVRGELIQTVAPPGADYAGYPTFVADGRLFFSSADLDADGDAAPGYIALLQPPYAGQAEIFYQADNLTVINAIVGDYLYFWQDHDAARIGLERPHEITHYRGATLRGWLP